MFHRLEGRLNITIMFTIRHSSTSPSKRYQRCSDFFTRFSLA